MHRTFAVTFAVSCPWGESFFLTMHPFARSVAGTMWEASS
jgi:hypothetical protein